MAPDIASRIRAKLSKRRHSGTPSLASTRTNASDADSQSQSHANEHGKHSQLSRDDTASSNKSRTSRARSWSLLGHSQTHLVDDSQPLKANGSDKAPRDHDRDSETKRSGTAHSDASSSRIDPLDVVKDKEKATGQDEPQQQPSPVAPTPNPTCTAGTSAGASAGDARARRVASGPTGNDLQTQQLQAPPPSSPRTGAALGLSSTASPSHLHSIHEDDSTNTPTSTANTATTDTEAGFDNNNNNEPSPTAGPNATPKKHRQHHDDDADADDTGPLSLAFVPPTPSAVAAAGFFNHQLPQTPPSTTSATFPRPEPVRRQSLLSNRQTTLIKTLLHAPTPNESGLAGPVLPIDGSMVTRKIWVKRPSASATIITIGEDDLVDDVRDMILRKYANSLGRTFDAPDLTIRIHSREQQKDRIMGPEEPMGRTLDAYFPGGQTVDEALIIDIPRRTPKASPRAPIPHHTAAGTVYYTDDGRPSEAGEGYFPPVGGIPSPRLPVPVAIPNAANGHSIAILGTGHLPTIPSPGGTRARGYKDRPDRPRLGRTHTSSPTIITNGVGSIATNANHPHGMQHYIPRGAHSHSRTHSEASDQHQAAQANSVMPLPTSPVPEPAQARVNTPPPRVASPRPSSTRPKKKKNMDHPSLPPGMLNGSVPPINVLIVEDNPINLKLLEAFVKRLKVRWQTAMNGFDAVKKWRTGGFHLVLMDIQLPGMNGLEATREIRRLERINSIGVFTSTPGSVQGVADEPKGELEEKDRLETLSLFKSPVIIVALTASSLQSDRHEALAAGCNDFLTKPVNFVWLERKVMEWGCMQALIDFDGWRKWKDFAQEAPADSSKKAASAKAKSKKNRLSLSST